jgi:hypothetical protein
MRGEHRAQAKGSKADVDGAYLGMVCDLLCKELVNTPAFPGPRNRKLSVLSPDKLWESGVAAKVP